MASATTKTPTPTKRRKPTKATAKPATTASRAKQAKAEVAEPDESPIPEMNAPDPVVVTENTPTLAEPALKKQELLAKVVARSGLPKRDVKPVVEAMLAVLGETLDEGRDLNLNPMGKVMIKKSKSISGGKVLMSRIRTKTKTAPDGEI